MLELERNVRKALPLARRKDNSVTYDVGSGEVNIFVGTNDPQRLYEELRALLMERGAWSDARIAYREADGDSYTVLWPKGLQEFKVI